jgi:hypothetical protein
MSEFFASPPQNFERLGWPLGLDVTYPPTCFAHPEELETWYKGSSDPPFHRRTDNDALDRLREYPLSRPADNPETDRLVDNLEIKRA